MENILQYFAQIQDNRQNSGQTLLVVYILNRGDNRRFERKTVGSDMDNGIKRGVTKKYHFSLKECRPIEELVEAINSLS